MVEKKAVYLVKDVARSTGLSIHTVKYYLKIGLLREVGRSPETNFRYFDETTIDRVHQICAFRRQGKTIREIQSLVKKNS
ncbi:MAG: MerR family transcriptional regulator [Candidatus Omnitrophica bacterium]|nr:MerR family transcriptional regulator [Candidatus Omnitrophota bacterium]